MPKKGVEPWLYSCTSVNLSAVFMYFYWNFEYTKDVTLYTVLKVGGSTASLALYPGYSPCRKEPGYEASALLQPIM